MPVSDFECQIVRGQIGRYLDGGVLSPEALAGLEEHLAECPSCKATVVERRAALLDALAAPNRAVVSMPVENPLVAALRLRTAREDAPETPSVEKEPSPKAAPRYAKTSAAKGDLRKPLALATLLGVVLLGMSRLTHTVTAPSAKAAANFAAESLPPAAPAKAPVVTTAPALVVPLKGAMSSRPSMETLFESSAKVNPDARETAPKPVSPKQISLKPRAATPAPRTSVRVYGLDGRPLKP